jgi:hypothetical protein
MHMGRHDHRHDRGTFLMATSHMRRGRWVSTRSALVLAATMLSCGRGADHDESEVVVDVLVPVTSEDSVTYSSVAGFARLSNGEILVAARIERVLWAVDIQGAQRRPVGGQGGGPGEYRNPGAVLRFRADTVLLFDEGARRLLAISGAGIPGRTIALPKAVPHRPRASDSLGNIYFQGRGTRPGPDGAQDRSAPVIRWNMTTGHVDTLFWIRPPREILARPAGGRPGDELRLWIVQPFAPGDDWAVFPDGRIAVVRWDPFRVEMWRHGAKVAEGPVLRYEPVSLSAADKVQPNVAVDVEWEWPEARPPFVPGAAIAGDNGELWSYRDGTANTRLYFALDSLGRPTSTIRVTARDSIVGLVGGLAFVARRDTHDLYSLRLFRRCAAAEGC